MEQQIAPTLWLPPGMCLLNHVPTMQLQPTSTLAPHQVTSQILKHPLLTVPAANILQNPHLLQQPQIVPTTQNIIHIPIENLLLPSPGKQTYEVAPSLVELPQCQPVNLQGENQLPLPPNSTLLPTDPTTFHRHHLGVSKVAKKKRISPSAKRRSRLRLIAFLEQKRKQQSELNPQEENSTLQPSPDIVTSYPDDATTPPSSSDDVTLSPQST